MTFLSCVLLLMQLCSAVQASSTNSNHNRPRIRKLQDVPILEALAQDETSADDATTVATTTPNTDLTQAQLATTPAPQDSFETTPSPTPPPQNIGVTVGGVIFYDINRNGSRDPNEPGVPNVTVQIRSCTNGRHGAHRTNGIGEFLVSLPSPGCYRAQLDITSLTFTQGSDVNAFTGRTEGVDINDGGSHFWYVGLEAPEGMTPTPTDELTGMPTNEPTQMVTEVPSLSPTISEAPTLPPVPTLSPTLSSAPSASPTKSTSPTECLVNDVVQENLMSSSPIVRASYGMIFSLSTPEKNKSLFDSGIEEAEFISITSISMRVLSPILNQAASTNYQVWSRMGDYKGIDEDGKEFDGRGEFIGWTLTADGNSLGATTTMRMDGNNVTAATLQDGDSAIDINSTDTTQQPEQEQNVIVQQDPLILDSNFVSSAYPSDKDKYEDSPSNLLGDGGMETINSAGKQIFTYLYKIPTSIFKPVLIPKYGGKVSFYVTLDRASLQYGNANSTEWDDIDVENGQYDENDERDMNVRIHVGEGVTSKTWTNVGRFFPPRRFLGKVWYEQVNIVPCHLYVGAPSMAPTELYIPPLPETVAAQELGAEGEDIETSFVVSVYLQQNINDAARMDAQVKEAFRRTMLDFLNEEYVLEHCIWGTSLDVEFQRLSLLDGVRDRRLYLRGGAQSRRWQNDVHRRTQTEITLLQVEMAIKGVAYDHEGICPDGSTPATATSRGENWEETMESIGIDFIMDNPDELGERLKEAHEYFGNTIALGAKPDFLERGPATEVDEEGVKETTTTEEEKNTMIPIIAGVAAAVLLLCLLGCFCFYRKKKRQQKPDVEEPMTEEASEMPKEVNIMSNMDDSEHKEEDGGVEQAPEGDETEGESETLVPDEPDPLLEAWPKLRGVPQLEEIVMMRGLPRRRSDPKLATIISKAPNKMRRRSISCLREVWTNLNKEESYAYAQEALVGSYMDELLKGTLYPVEDPDVLEWERRQYLTEHNPDAPYVPYGGHLEHNLIDDAEAERLELAAKEARKEEEARLAAERIKNAPKPNPLVMQQVEMLEAKWKQLKAEYGDEDVDESDSDDDVLRGFDVNKRIEQLMTHIEKLEMERKLKLAELKRQELEEEELARKRMVKGGQGINYNEEFNKEFVIRKKKKKKKKKKKIAKRVSEDLEMSDMSSEEEGAPDDEFDVKWMRLKVPLAAQHPEAMKDMVERGNEMG